MLERLRERIETFLEAAARDRCRFELEDRPDVRLGERYLRSRDLFSQDRIRDVQRELAGASGTEERRLRFVLEFLAAGRSVCVSAGELDRLRTWEANTVLTVLDRPIPLRGVRAHLRRTADRSVRLELEEARLSAVDEQLQLLEGLLAHQRDAVEELGYGTYVEGCEVLSGIDLRGLAREAERFLADSEPAYRELLAWHLPRLAGVEPLEAREGDAARLELGEPWLEYFPDSRLLSRAQEALSQTGLDATAQGRLRTATRPSLPGGGGAVVCSVRVPDEVVLTVTDEPGREAHASLMRALGFALHRAFTRPELPVELRRLGDESVPRGVGRLLEGLLANRSFLERVCAMPRSAMPGYLRLSALVDLMRIRRDAALLRHELTAYAEPDPRETSERYSDLLSGATGLRHDPRAALWALRPPFRVARSLRAAQLGAMLAEHLRDRFDEDWWRNPRSGELLGTLFQDGQSYTAAELSVQLTSQPLSLERVRGALEERL